MRASPGSKTKTTVENIAGITCRVIRTQRKSIALIVGDDALLTVRAPYYLPQQAIEVFVNEKRGWIARQKHDAYRISRKYAPILFLDGESLPYQGEYYAIARAAVKTPYISDTTIFIPERHAKERFISWIKAQALGEVTARTSYYAGVMQLSHGKIRISSAKTRWGSCSATDNLSFTWRLLMCPPKILDYVVIHELSHIPYKNHGSDFWALVEENLPDYKLCQKWLKENRKILDII